jgi:hypothetical protein
LAELKAQEAGDALEEELHQIVGMYPSRELLGRYYRLRHIPEFNTQSDKLGIPSRLCPQCWREFVVTHGNARYCTDACAMKVRNTRRREKKRAAADKLEAKIRSERLRHETSCFICRSGGRCSEWEATEDRMRGNHPRSVRTTGRVTLERAEKKNASQK